MSSAPVLGLYDVMLGYGIDSRGALVCRATLPEASILTLYMSLSEA
jgi:hypothetical protein